MALPTKTDIFNNALNSLNAARIDLGDARDWLNSDWKPDGAPLPDAAANARYEGLRRIGQLKNEIDELKQLMCEAIDDTIEDNLRRHQ